MKYNSVAEALRAQRTLTPAQVESRAAKHAPLVRYRQRLDRQAPAAH